MSLTEAPGKMTKEQVKKLISVLEEGEKRYVGNLEEISSEEEFELLGLRLFSGLFNLRLQYSEHFSKPNQFRTEGAIRFIKQQYLPYIIMLRMVLSKRPEKEMKMINRYQKWGELYLTVDSFSVLPPFAFLKINPTS